ncbi:MAG: hypothetical protein CL609_23390 [Anaerolineaceae bacterium]|nr:hypothetical protein [Anaerolineaceae bacterium]
MFLLDLVIRILINVSVGFIFIYLLSIASIQIKKKVSPFYYKIVMGVGFGLTAWFTMYTAAYVTNLPDFDFKLFLISVVGVLQGPIAAITSMLIIVIYAALTGINGINWVILLFSTASAVLIGSLFGNRVRKDYSYRIWLVIFFVSLIAVLWKLIWLPSPQFEDLLQQYALPAMIFYILSGLAASYIYLDREYRLNQVKNLEEKVKQEKAQREEITRLYEQLRTTKEELKTNYVGIETTYVDPLTGLPNKKAFNEELHKTLEQCLSSPNKRSVFGAVAFMDLDNFKLLNDSFGHSFGDQLLIQVSERIKETSSDNLFAARVGGDEFVLIFFDETDLTIIQRKLKEFQDLFIASFHLINKEIQINSSIGVVLYPQDGITVEEILKHADTALYQAKDRGKNQIVFFDNSMAKTATTRMNMEINLRNAILNRSFTIVYQPQYSIRTHELIGVEALLRWWNPEIGHVSPAEFIPIAEESGLINDLGRWVLEEACIMAKKLNQNRKFPIIMSVNISTKQVHMPDFVDETIEILKKHEVNPNWMTLEITETVLMNSYDETILKIKALTEYGINFALDDFGTGYSSLSYLLSIPSNLLKIDRSFIQDMPTSERHVRLVNTIIDVAHDLNMDVMAEGVETEEQMGILQQYNCDYLQGYLFNKPLSADDLLLLTQ